MRQLKDFTYLAVERPVEGGADFLNRAQRLASLVFYTAEAPDTLVEIIGIDEEETPSVIGAPAPLFRIYDADELQLPLIERKTVPWARAEGSFSQATKQLKNGKIDSPKHRPKHPDGEPRFIHHPLLKQLVGIQLEYDFPKEDEVPFIVSRIGYRFDEDLTNGGMELTLLPQVSDRATAMLIAQSKRSARALVEASVKVAYPNGYAHIEIPFARIFKSADPNQLEEYINKLEVSLPQQLTAGKPRIRSGNSS
jgi:hypothetical protein